MAPEPTHWLLALLAATAIAGAARSRRSLSRSGTVAAIFLGTLLVGTAGWWAGVLLVAFFASSSILSRPGSRSHEATQARGSERDAVQVFANGGVALTAALLYAATGHTAWIVVIAGAIAAANADTWSTEIGRFSPSQPRLITTGRLVETGTSGAVSVHGLAGALGGGALIGTLAATGWSAGWLPGEVGMLVAFLAVTLGGISGSLLDSLLGATVQDQRWCDTCKKLTEQHVHRCGTPTRSIRGLRWLDNDVVNAACSAGGAAIALIVVMLLQ